MSKGDIKMLLAILCALFLGISSNLVGGETISRMPYEISVIYEYQNTVAAVDIIKTSAFSGEDDVLLVAAKNENGETVRAKAIMLDMNMPVGVNEVTVHDFEISENQTVFVTVWDSISSLTPLTDGNCPTPVKETERVIGNAEDWTLTADGKRILDYLGDETDVIIPNYVNGKHITTIGPNSTPDNIYSIFGSRAEEITSFKISDGIKKIGPTTFAGCKNATNSIYIPESVIYIGAYAFYNCTSLTGELVIPDGMDIVNPAAFAGCFEITSVKFPESLRSIGGYSFYGCKNLEGELAIPEKVSRVEDYAFAYCSKITGNLEIPNVVYIGDCAFLYCSGFNGNLDIGSAEHIGYASFAYCENMRGKLELSDKLEYIGSVAFQYCRFKGNLTLPTSLVHIGDAAFNHCTQFENEVLVIPANVKTLGGDRGVKENTYYSSHLFYDFGNPKKFREFRVAPGNKYFCADNGVLYDIDKTRIIAYPSGKTEEVFEIPEGVTQLDELCFGKCTALKEIVLPDSYVISERAPANVVNQNGNTLAVSLYNYTGVERISVKETNPNYKSVDGALYSKDGESLWYCSVKIGESYAVKEGTKRIETGAIYGVESQNKIKSFEIPASVTYIAPETVGIMNYLFKGNIIVHEENTNYGMIEGLLKAVK